MKQSDLKGRNNMEKHIRILMCVMLLAAFLMTGLPTLASSDPPANGLIVMAGETYTVEENTAFDEIIIDEGGALAPAEGYSLIVVANGKVVRPEAGKLRNVELILQPIDNTYGVFDETGNAEGYSYRFLFNPGGDTNAFVPSALGGAEVSSENVYTVFDGNGASFTVNDDRMNALAAEENVIFRNFDLTVKGIGVCEFGDAFGAAISAAGTGDVIVEDVNVTTVGAIMSTLNSASGNVLVMDSEFHGYGTAEDASGLHSGIPSYSNVQGSLTEVPWVLGLKGTLRATNVIGDANVLYYNNSATCNGWGVYSTDGGKTIIMIDDDAAYDASKGPSFDSLYGTYILGLPAYLYGYQADLTGAAGNTYGIVARTGFTMGASSQDNLIALDAAINAPAEADASDEAGASGEAGGSGEPATIADAAGVWQMFMDEVGIEAVPERRSVIRARFGIMSHGANGGVFDITDTDIIASDAAFLLKDAYMDIRLDSSDTIDAPIIIHQQLTDDASMGEYAYDHCWAAATPVFLYDVEASGEPTKGASATMTGMTLEGDFYNTDSNGAYLDLTFDGTEVTGVISSAQFIHENASYWLVENPAFDDSAAESQDNLRYIAVDAEGHAYETLLTNTLFGGIVYSPAYEDDNGIVTFLPGDRAFDPADIVGYAIFYTDSHFCSQGTITPREAVNDPVYVTLTGGSVWNVTGESYLARLDIEPGSAVNGTVTVDGQPVNVSDGGSWTGNIVITNG